MINVIAEPHFYNKQQKVLLIQILTHLVKFCSMFIMTHPYSGGEDNKDSVEDNQDGQKAQKKEPEPEKYVNLFVDNVEAEHAQTVELLLPCRRADRVKSATKIFIFV